MFDVIYRSGFETVFEKNGGACNLRRAKKVNCMAIPWYEPALTLTKIPWLLLLRQLNM
jgi:hypothetical protein